MPNDDRRRVLLGVAVGTAGVVSGCLRFQDGGGGATETAASEPDESGGADGETADGTTVEETTAARREGTDTTATETTVETRIGTNATDDDGDSVLLFQDGRATVTGRTGMDGGRELTVRVLRDGDALASEQVAVTSTRTFAATVDLSGVEDGVVAVEVRTDEEGVLASLQTARVVSRRIEGQWPTFRVDARNTGSVAEAAAPVESFVTQWRYDLGTPIEWSPAVADGAVYVTDADGTLYAIDTVERTQRWETDVGAVGRASPTVSEGTVYAYSKTDQTVTAVDAAGGTTEWSVTLASSRPDDRGQGSSPTVADGTVYVGDENHGLYALDAESGETLWTAELEQPHVTTPAVDLDVVVVPTRTSSGTSLAALDAASGAVKWERGWGGFGRSPAIVAGTVYVSRSAKLEAWDLVTGERQWEGDAGSSVEPNAVTDGVVWTTSSTQLLAVGTEDGTVRRSVDLGDSGGGLTVGGGAVYVETDDELHVVDADSADELATVPFENRIVGEPVVVDGRVVLSTSNGEIHVLDGLTR
jgi:outer membrane protein assembly factor BamB